MSQIDADSIMQHIEQGLLPTVEEINWINSYHQEVYERLSPLLDEAHRDWLKEKTAPIIK